MTKEDIEKMRGVDPEITKRLENGETITAPKYLELFHDFQRLDNQSKISFIELIEEYLENE